MNRRLRHGFFRHHWRMILFAVGAAGFIIFTSAVPDKGTVFAAIVAAGLSTCFFVQQQRLAETKLSWEIITLFNTRYDGLNDRLMKMRCEDECTDYEVVWDYFNLRAEELLFYSVGYIDPRVWRSWCIGMLSYFEVEPFAKMWNEDEARDSYYGLTIQAIRKGASL